MPQLKVIELVDNIADSAARSLFDYLSNSEKKDYSNIRVLVPTKQAARLLRVKLAEISTKQKKFFAGLKINNLDSLILDIISDDCASKYEDACAWISAIDSLSDNLPELFLHGTEHLDDSNKYALSKDIQNLRRQILGEFKNFTEVANSLTSEQALFLDLAKLESLYKEILHKKNLKDSLDFVLSEISKEDFFEGLGEIILVATPELANLSFSYLKNFEKFGGKLTVFAFGSDALSFDKYGAPSLSWCEKNLLNNKNFQFKAFLNQENQSVQIAKLVSQSKENAGGKFAIACENGVSRTMIAQALEKINVSSFEPSGKIEYREIIDILKLLQRFLEEVSYDNFLELLKRVCKFIAEEVQMSSEEVLNFADEFKNEFLPRDFVSASSHKPHKIFDSFNNLVSDFFEEGSFSRKLESFLNKLSSFFSEDFLEQIDSINHQLQMIAKAELRGLNLKKSLLIKILCDSIDVRNGDAQNSDSIALDNWFEIFWSDRPVVIVADFCDSNVPQNRYTNQFLSEKILKELHLQNQDYRYARDAYMFDALMSSRKENAIFLYSRTSYSGEVLNPSRLLMQVEPSDMPKCIEKVFYFEDNKSKAMPFKKAWDLQFKKDFKISSLSVSDFKNYIECPFRFYLKKFLKMEDFDISKKELDAMQLGTILHKVFERFGRSEFKNCADENEIRKFFLSEFDKIIYATYGKDLSPMIYLQAQAMKTRLQAAAKIQAEHCAQGWTIKNVEMPIEDFEISSLKIKGRIDRIDENQNGDLLIIDYKSSDSVDVSSSKSLPEQAHLKSKDWIDLQMPLYLQAMKEKYPDRKISCAYFAMPKHLTKTCISVWELDIELLDSAIQKAIDVVESIKNKNFEPTSKKIKYDNFEKIFPFAKNDLSEFIKWEDVQ